MGLIKAPYRKTLKPKQRLKDFSNLVCTKVIICHN